MYLYIIFDPTPHPPPQKKKENQLIFTENESKIPWTDFR